MIKILKAALAWVLPILAGVLFYGTLAVVSAAIVYGWVTDCRDTADVYVYCWPGDGR